MTADVSPPPVLLPQNLDLTRADSLLAALQACLTHDAPVHLDGSGVAHISTASLQVLVAAARTARALGRQFVLAAPSDVLRAAAQDLGLACMLGMEAR